ncbi:MAG TPA: helix-turn-helix transcriptional regulator [Thermoanaerobaculia bacterium]|nr:helix-turn-helix transcriptional regulator [Thermoanaerobaculia bacterium]
MPRPAPPLLSATLTALRNARGWTGRDLAAAAGVSPRNTSRYERDREPSRARLESFAAAMGYGPQAIDWVLLALAGARAPAAPPSSPVDPSAAEERRRQQVAARFGLMVQEVMAKSLLQLARARHARRERRRAGGLWARLTGCTGPERRLLVEKAREFQTWPLAERLCHESERAAPDSADKALELARLALRVAELAPGGEAWRSRLQGYCLAFVANALRVGNDLPAAEQTLARAWQLWRAGAAGDPGVLAEWRLLDLEASLRRGQRLFAQALECLDRALAAAPPGAAGRILLKRAFTLAEMGEAERAIEVLAEAAALLDRRREPRLVFGLKFNLAACLCQLGQFARAEILLPEVRELALALRLRLDLARVVWLEAKVAAGLGRSDEAVAAFEAVRREFLKRELPYDFALASLELAVFHLDRRRPAQVRRLAAEMHSIFEAQKVPLEALRALRIFCAAAGRDAASVQLARRLLQYLERARHDPELRFEP